MDSCLSAFSHIIVSPFLKMPLANNFIFYLKKAQKNNMPLLHKGSADKNATDHTLHSSVPER
jgi:hypothetical protein